MIVNPMIWFDCGDDDPIGEILVAADLLHYVVPQYRAPKTRAYMDQVFLNTLPLDFRQQCRMDKTPFVKLCELLGEQEVFQNQSTCEQTPVCLQIVCALERLGKYGNGASLGSLKRAYGIRQGTTSLFTARVITALNDQAAEMITWPSHEQKARIKADLVDDDFFCCIGCIDGTTFPLAQCGKTYFDHKYRYSVNDQVICDHRRRIVGLFVGLPGSCADITCYGQIDIRKNPRVNSGEAEYLLADSGYPITTTIVPVIKGQEARQEANIRFNMCVSHTRVVNENCIGTLKTRILSLREIRTQIKGEIVTQDMERLCDWVIDCAVLHNLLLIRDDCWDACDDEVDEGELDQGRQVAEGE
uniref:DDE Tnp4 domain-containing protein n=1 Tax=Hyaloperonospora arabidopsidis (strain Emoy2) TaxID=559515 RepID=M4B2B0_HYAAE